MSNFDFSNITISHTSDNYSQYVPSPLLADEVSKAMNNILATSHSYTVKYQNGDIVIAVDDGYSRFDGSPENLVRFSNVYQVLRNCGFEILKHIKFKPDFLFPVGYKLHTIITCDYIDLYGQWRQRYMVGNPELQVIKDPEWLVWIIRLIEVVQNHVDTAGEIKTDLAIRICKNNDACRFNTLRDFKKFLWLMIKSSEYVDTEHSNEMFIRWFITIAYLNLTQKQSLIRQSIPDDSPEGQLCMNYHLYPTVDYCEMILNRLENVWF